MKNDPNQPCYACHRINESITYASVGSDITVVQAGQEAHAATTVACMLCHQFNATSGLKWSKFVGYPAGGFSQPINSNKQYTDGGHPGGWAAHQQFIQRAVNTSAMRDSNEACVACHTHVKVNITWKHAHDLEFSATWKDEASGWYGDDEFPPTHFNVTHWDTNGTVTTHSYGNITTGNTSPWGGWYK